MTKEILLMQYQSECLSALKSVANIQKPFEKTFMDTMKLFMAIPSGLTAGLTLPIWIWPGARNTRWTKENYTDWGYMQNLSKGMFPWPSGIRWTGGQTSGNFISLQTIPWMDARCWIITEPGSSWSFALEMESSMQESPTVSQPTSESWIFTSMRRSQLSTWPKRHVRSLE